uniref:Uncharacterized protein n=1 Tax=Romanomermis culicivorax TaxID=13658 RepID=A0A915K3U7_ROMCU
MIFGALAGRRLALDANLFADPEILAYTQRRKKLEMSNLGTTLFMKLQFNQLQKVFCCTKIEYQIEGKKSRAVFNDENIPKWDVLVRPPCGVGSTQPFWRKADLVQGHFGAAILVQSYFGAVFLVVPNT